MFLKLKTQFLAKTFPYKARKSSRKMPSVQAHVNNLSELFVQTTFPFLDWLRLETCSANAYEIW